MILREFVIIFSLLFVRMFRLFLVFSYGEDLVGIFFGLLWRWGFLWLLCRRRLFLLRT